MASVQFCLLPKSFHPTSGGGGGGVYGGVEGALETPLPPLQTPRYRGSNNFAHLADLQLLGKVVKGAISPPPSGMQKIQEENTEQQQQQTPSDWKPIIEKCHQHYTPTFPYSQGSQSSAG